MNLFEQDARSNHNRSFVSFGALAALIALSAIAFLTPTTLSHASSSFVQLQSFSSHSRIMLQIDESVETVWHSLDGGFELELKGVWLSDLGAPLGGEEEWSRRLSEKLKDARVESVSFKEMASGTRIVGRWNFPKGSSRPAEPRMEAFEFREKSPPQFIVDFWPKKGPTVGEVAAQKARAKLEAERLAETTRRKKRQERRLAADQAKFEMEDLSKICKAPLKDSDDVFLSFRPVHERPNLATWIKLNTADEGFEYLRPKSDDRDAQYMKLALDLYSQGKPGLVIKTEEFFTRETPNSRFAIQMQFLKANALMKLNMKPQAEGILRDIVARARDTQFALMAQIYLATQNFIAQNHLQALDGFQWLIQNHPKDSRAWIFHLANAETLYSLKQTDRAAKEFQWISENAPDEVMRAKAAFRTGDLYLERSQYERALAAYYQAMRRFPEQVKQFPEVSLNRAESLYWLDDMDRARDAFAAFVKENPSHPSGWRATYRIAEITGRRDDAASQKTSREWFMKTVNEYPYSPGSTLARLRLLPCGDHGGFTLETAERFFNRDAKAFDGSNEVRMDGYKDMKALSRVFTYVALGTPARATDVAIEDLQSGLRTHIRDRIAANLEILFRKSVLEMLAQGKSMEAIQFYEKRSNLIPRGTVDPDYILSLSQVASDLGLGKLGSELAHAYTVADMELQRKGRGIASRDPDAAKELDVILKKADAAFAEAKAIWVELGLRPQTTQPQAAKTERVKTLLNAVPAESEHSFEKNVILGLIASSEEQYQAALDYALKAQILVPATSAGQAGAVEDAIRLESWIATLQQKVGHADEALRSLKRLEEQVASRSTPAAKLELGPGARIGLNPAMTFSQLIVLQGEVLESMGRWGEAATAYQRAVTQGIGGNHLMYQYARALTKTGEAKAMKRAQDTFQKVASSDQDDFWKKLAREALANDDTRQGGQ